MPKKVLTPLQERILELLFEDGIAQRGWFFTGGTALAAFYLQHRLSEDLDFFTRSRVSLEEDLKRIRNLLSSAFPLSVRSVSADGLILFVDGMKTEFHRDVPARMAPPKTFGKIVVESLEDIAVNKVCCIVGRPVPEPKDYCDLHYILTAYDWTLDYLISRAREKEALFDDEDGVLMFAARLLDVNTLDRLPKMLKPLSLPELRRSLAPRAKELIRRLRPGGR